MDATEGYAREARESVKPEAKEKLFDDLAAAGVANVTVEFDGYSDQGAIESISFDYAESTVHGDINTIEQKLHDLHAQEDRLREPIEDAVYNALPGGWEINDGAFGEVIFDVETRSIKVDLNERYTAFTEHKYEV